MIEKIVAEYFNLTEDEIKSKTHLRAIVKARQISMWFYRSQTKLSFSEIGNIFGKDHSTVIDACRKVDGFIKFDAKFAAEIELITDEINQYGSKTLEDVWYKKIVLAAKMQLIEFHFKHDGIFYYTINVSGCWSNPERIIIL